MISILLVEDDAILSYVVGKYVEKLGHKLLNTVVTADEAIDNVNSLKPDLILMDIHLIGDKDGITAVETIRKNSINTPVLYLTGNSDPTNKKRMQIKISWKRLNSLRSILMGHLWRGLHYEKVRISIFFRSEV